MGEQTRALRIHRQDHPAQYPHNIQYGPRMAGRPQLDIGTYGKFGFVVRPPRCVEATAKFRDFDGRVRRVSRRGTTKAAAERALKKALADRRSAVGTDVTPETRVTDLADEWLRRVDASDRAIGTKQIYRGSVELHVRPAIGQLRVREVTVGVCDRALAAIAEHHGPSAAKTARAVLSGIMGLAARHDAVRSNPIRDTESISVSAKRTPRALTVVEARGLSTRLRNLGRACELDLPDLVDFCLATGARIGEVLACRAETLDLDAGTWEVNATIVRVKGAGLLIQPRPKTAAGWRVLALPPAAVAMLRRRSEEPRLQAPDGVVFGSPAARSLRDPSNCAGDLQELRKRPELAGYDWVTFHTFRKTVATRMDEAGCSAREIADQLGHSKPSMTQDVYLGRQVATARAAEILRQAG